MIAHDQYPAKASVHDVNKALERRRCANGGLHYKIDLKKGDRVMLTANLDVEDRLINGQIGTIVKSKINAVSAKSDVIHVRFDDQNAEKEQIGRSNDTYVRTHSFVPIVPVLTRIKVKENRPSSPEIQRTQFPLKLAWAYTVHKVQGLTLDRVVFSFELFKQRQFNCGEVYVALSRVKLLSQLYLLGDINPSCIREDPRVGEAYERLRTQCFEFEAPKMVCKSSSENIVISLLNVRSLKKHCTDIKNDSKIIHSDIIAFTGTQLKPLQNIDIIQEALCEFQIVHEDQTNNYLSLANLYKP